MHINAELSLRYPNKKTANHIQKILSIDDGNFVSSNVKENIIYSHIESESLSSFLQTIDDYLSCLAVAEHIMEKKKKKKGEITE